jgi:general secretion pathway protein F
MSASEPHPLTDWGREHAAPPQREAKARAASKTADVEALRRVSTKVRCRIVRQLSTLLRAGMPLVPALSALAEQLHSPDTKRKTHTRHHVNPMAQVVQRIRDDVNEGSSLAEAFGKYPVFSSPLFVGMVAAGEKSGTLEEVLSRLADILDKRAELHAKVRSALAYPIMMAAVAVGVVMFLLSYVVPSITKLFAEMHQDLPWPTVALIAVSDFTEAHLGLLVAFFFIVVVGLYVLAQTQDGKVRADRIKLRLPLFGPLLFRLEVARLTRTLGILLKSGIPVIAAIEITQRVVQNRVVAEAVNTVKELVHRGETIANAVRSTGMFPPVVFHLIATGQMSGNVEEGLTDIAEMYDGEVETSIQTLMSLLEPIILMVMGAIIGFIVLAILLPIFEINQAL